MITIYDVAKKAGVSIATVSYSLNGKKSVSEETRKRVKEIADEMGFIPNSTAQSLTYRKTNIMGLVVADIQNIFTSTFIKHLESYARKEDFYLLLGSTSNNTEIENEIIERFIAKNVDSLVISPGMFFSEELYERIINKIKKRNIPFVMINAQLANTKSNCVLIDLEEGQYTLVKYLLLNGHRDILFITGKKESYHSTLKYKGFTRALQEFGLNHMDTLFVECGEEETFNNGYKAMSGYLNSGNSLPDAVAAVNDPVAQGIVKALMEKGYRIPQDISVVGNDDTQMTQTNLLPMTTLKSPVEDIARLCVEILKETKGTGKITKQYSLNQELVVRGSVKAK